MASRILVAASSNGPGGYFTGCGEIVVTQGYLQNYRSPA